MIAFLIDTSKPQVQVVLIKDSEILGKESWMGDKTLGTKLLSVIDELLAKSSLKLEDVDRFAVHGGPGHYSALRSGIVAATFLAQGAGKDLVQIDADEMDEMITQAMVHPSVKGITPRY